jgi:N-acyl homoserine lactone hydrolase
MTAIEKIFIIDGGLAKVKDGSIYSPGVNVGVPMTLSCNAYLIRHKRSWLLWDTGIEDDLVSDPEGRIIAHGIQGIVRRTLASQLDQIGVAPDDIGTIAISHAHFDHVGNCRLFRKAKWVAQRAEYDAMFGDNPEQFGYSPDLYSALRHNPVELVDGDHDFFGDGAVRLISTPGHTPGHCSLLVRLPETGTVLLSGDVAHNRENFRLRRVPSFNADQRASTVSMDKVDALLRVERGTMWVNHDTAQSEALPYIPGWIV